MPHELVIAKGGSKIQESKPSEAAAAGRGGMGLKGRGGPLTAREVPISDLVWTAFHAAEPHRA